MFERTLFVRFRDVHYPLLTLNIISRSNEYRRVINYARSYFGSRIDIFDVATILQTLLKTKKMLVRSGNGSKNEIR